MTHWILDEQGQLDFVAHTAYPTEIKTIELTDYEPEAQKFLPVGDKHQDRDPRAGRIPAGGPADPERGVQPVGRGLSDSHAPNGATADQVDHPPDDRPTRRRA